MCFLLCVLTSPALMKYSFTQLAVTVYSKRPRGNRLITEGRDSEDNHVDY